MVPQLVNLEEAAALRGMTDKALDITEARQIIARAQDILAAINSSHLVGGARALQDMGLVPPPAVGVPPQMPPRTYAEKYPMTEDEKYEAAVERQRDD